MFTILLTIILVLKMTRDARPSSMLSFKAGVPSFAFVITTASSSKDVLVPSVERKVAGLDACFRSLMEETGT